MRVFDRLTIAGVLVSTILVTASQLRAQAPTTIHGTIRDSVTGAVLGGVQVRAVGTTRGAVTDTAGQYTIRIDPGTYTVRAQRIGYGAGEGKATVAAGQTAEVNFTLKQVAQGLSEVVVLGYGTASREQVTGAVSDVSGSDIANTPVASIDAALQGKAPGVQVIQNAGNPGNAITVRIRGGASISGTNQPLYVLDGIPIQSEDISQEGFGGQDINAVTSLNPDEIENITILKDASSAAIYGSRASNGVVMITTKRGQSGKPKLVFNAYTGWQDAPKKLSLLNSKQYVEYMGEGATNDGYDAAEQGFAPGINDTVFTDWQSDVLQTAPINNITLGVSGGSDRIQYYLSGSYFDQQGIVITSQYQRASGRLNVDFAATDKLLFRTNLSYAHEINHRISSDNVLTGILPDAIGNPTNVAARRSDGSFSSEDDGLAYVNSLAIAQYNTNPTTSDRFIGNVEAQYDMTQHWRVTGRVGADALGLDERVWESPLVENTYAASISGVAEQGYSQGRKYTLEGFVTYDQANENNHLTVVGGSSVEYNSLDNNFLRGEGFGSGDFQYVGNAAKITNYDGTSSGHNLASFFGRANWTLTDRYLFTASMRVDGSSRFAPDNRWGAFPAGAFAWYLSKESWAAGLGRKMDVKFRASYGLTGNQGIDDFAYLATYGSANYGGIPGTAPNNFGNPSLRWETTKQLDLGADLAFFRGRVSLIVDYYDRQTSNLLVQRPVPAASGFTTYWDNVGDLTNQGWEFGLTTVNIEPKTADGFRWTTDLNFSTNHNKVTALYRDQPFFGTSGVNYVTVGQPLGAFYLLKFLGVDPQTGDAVYQDTNGDGQITTDDRVIAGSPQPTWYGGMYNTLQYKAFDFRFGFQYAGGNKVYNGIGEFADDGGYHYDNKTTRVLTRWQKPGDITDEPRASFDGTSGAREISTRLLEDGSYLRLQELSLGWQLPGAFARAGNLRALRLYVSARNVYTWAHYSGYTPDVNSYGSSGQINLSYDFYAIPVPRTFSIGISGDW